jgi:anti-anti-sigma regulatory factor
VSTSVRSRRPAPTLAIISATGPVRICAPAELAGVSAVSFRTVVEQVFAARPGDDVMVDMSRVRTMSRDAALMLLECIRRGTKSRRRVLLHRPSPAVTQRVNELSLTAAFSAAGVRARG